ncbi:MAG: Mur ligase family protein [Dehalococcoidia bacterium]
MIGSTRRHAAVLAAKSSGTLLRLAGRGGTALPGLLAERIDPAIVAGLAGGLARGAALVTGTNGKTTTSALIASALRAGGLVPIHNVAGSNMMRGLAATLCAAAGWNGRLPTGRRGVGILEVDEAVAPIAARAIRPRVVVITNLFRDQLDRYAELETVAALWRKMAEELVGATLVLNADDPLVGALPTPPDGRRIFYGIDDRSAAGPPGAADSIWCPRCSTQLEFLAIWYAHLGDYRCPGCGYTRPVLDVAAREVRPAGFDGADLCLSVAGRALAVRLPLPGLYNVSNALAAFAGALAMGVPSEMAARALAATRPAFGRTEQSRIDGREVAILLVKNPTGFDRDDQHRSGRKRHPRPAAGPQRPDCRRSRRILDLGCRLRTTCRQSRRDHRHRRSCGRTRLRPEVCRCHRRCRRAGCRAGPRLALGRRSGRLCVLPTYTALIDLHSSLADRAGVARFWERR